MRLLATLAILCFATAAQAQSSEAELKARFRTRLSAIEALKDAGKIGETAAGTLAAVSSADAQAAQLIAEENRDRGELYRLIAARTGETPANVAKQNAIRNYREAKPDHYLRTQSGQWVQKKSLGAGAPAS